MLGLERIGACLLAWLMLAGCDDAGTDGDVGASLDGGVMAGSFADDETLESYYRHWCALYERCGSTIHPDLESCVETNKCAASAVLSQVAITKAELLDCAQVVEQVSCDRAASGTPDVAACIALTEKLMGAFGTAHECANCAYDQVCSHDDRGCASCVPRAATGEPCSAGDCFSGDFCNETGHCEPRRAQGMPCTIAQQCEGGVLQPRSMMCREGVCTPTGEAGAPCEEVSECQWQLTCDAGRCTPLSAPGERCSSAGDCEFGTYCFDGTCARICAFRSLAAGERCAGDIHCQGYCDDTGRCQQHLEAGAPCNRDTQCAERLICPGGADPRCEPARAEGQPCDLGNDCESGLCEARRCVPRSCP